MHIEDSSSSKPESTLLVAPSKVFTFPTRLADAWVAQGLEIHLPGYCLSRPSLSLSVRTGVTNLRHFGLRTLPKYLYAKIAPAISVTGTPLFDTRCDTDGNIAHVLLNAGPALLHSKQTFGEVTAIVKSNVSAMGREAYRLLGCSVLNTDRDVRGEVIVPPDWRNAMYLTWYAALFSAIEIAEPRAATPERVFLSRKGPRRLVNEEEVEQTLARYGFHKMYFEDIPLAEQWWIARNAQAVVGIHGAALASLVFNGRGVKLLELFHPGFVVNHYRHLTNAIGGTWCGVTGQMPAEIVRELDVKRNGRKFAYSPIRIDLDSLRRALDFLDLSPL